MSVAESGSAARRTCGRSDWLACGLLAGLLVCQFWIGVMTARTLSVTHDEYWHLPVGILNLKTGRFDHEPLNPPLTRIISATATALAEPTCYQGPVEVSPDLSYYGLHFLRLTGERHQRCFVWGRAANLLFATLTGILLAVWSWQWWGRTAAGLTVLLWCTEPTVLAHSALVTPDAGLTCLVCAFWYSLWNYFQRPTLRRGAVCGILLGLAQLTKFTAAVLVPLVCVVWLIWCLRRDRQPGPSRRGPWGKAVYDFWAGFPMRRGKREGVALAEPGAMSEQGDLAARQEPRPPGSSPLCLWGQFGLMLLISLCVLNLGYLGEGLFSTLNQVQPRSATVLGWMRRVPVLARVPLPFPKSYLIGLDAQKQILEAQHPVYLDRAWSTGGFRSYFCWALWYKLPHVWQILCLGALVRCVAARVSAADRVRLGFIGIPAAVLFVIASLSGMQLGIRYILPVFPFLCLLAGSCFATADQSVPSRWRRRLVLAVVLIAPLSLRHHPEHLAYFNELAGGPEAGGEHLLDSNLDWGQDLLELRSYIHKHADRRWKIAYFGSLPPGELGLQYDLPSRSAEGPVPGSYAVSVNYVYGRPHVIFDEHGTPRSVNIGEFDYFRLFQPTHRIGASIWIYQIRQSDLLRLSQP